MKFLAAACLVLALAAPVAAQGLPSSVSEPYRAYQTAMEAGDEAAALEPAYQAWQAAEAANIDAETTGLLADNYAALASAAGQHEQAATAFARSAEILEDAEGGTLTTADTWRLAALAAYQAGEESRTERYADRAIDILGALPDSREVSAAVFQTETILSYRQFDRSNMRAAGRHAERAIAALLEVGPVVSMDAANIAFFAGIANASDYNHEEAAFYFTIASYIYGATSGDADTRQIADAWGYYSRTAIGEEERLELVRRLDASGYRPTECDDEDAGCGAGETGLPDYPEGTVVEDASPIQRREVTYPTQLLNAGYEGIVLVRFAVEEDGSVDDIQVLYSVPHSAFGEASERAMRNWRYNPLRVNGVPTRREGVVTQFVFQITE